MSPSNQIIVSSLCRTASSPFGDLRLANGAFYSNALNGGADGIGAVYKVSTAGKESVLYSFAGPPADGRYPIAGLAVKNGEFYGTTGYGGTADFGTVFKGQRVRRRTRPLQFHPDHLTARYRNRVWFR